MKHKNTYIFPLVSQGGVVVSTFLLSVGIASAAIKPNTLQPTGASIQLAQAQPELEQLRQERQVQQQVQAEANRIFNRTMSLFNILLATLALLLAAAIVALILLRRSVIREVAEIVRANLKELGELEVKLNTANQKVDNILKEAEDIVDDINDEAGNLQQEINVKRQGLSELQSELSQSTQQVLADLDSQRINSQAALATLSP